MATTPVAALLADVDRLRTVLARVRTPQVASAEVLGHMRAVATAWFGTYKAAAGTSDTNALDAHFQWLLTASAGHPTVNRVRSQLRDIRGGVVALQTQMIAAPATAAAITDAAPSFAAVPDPMMQQILMRRWNECTLCIQCGAPLSATVMMGGLLESLFLARVNREPNPAPIFTARTAPRDRTGTTRPLNDWGLGNYISVAHELGWITRSGRDVSAVLQNYRNYIHPHKELVSQASLTISDARMFWAVAKELAVQLL